MFSACDLRGRALRRDRGVARLHHRLERAALVAGIALHGLDQVGNEVVTLLELHVDVGERLVDPLPHGDQPVVDHDDPDHERGDDSENDPGRSRHAGLPFSAWPQRPSSSRIPARKASSIGGVNRFTPRPTGMLAPCLSGNAALGSPPPRSCAVGRGSGARSAPGWGALAEDQHRTRMGGSLCLPARIIASQAARLFPQPPTPPRHSQELAGGGETRDSILVCLS